MGGAIKIFSFYENKMFFFYIIEWNILLFVKLKRKPLFEL